MRISCQSFSLPKAGRSFTDCEDAYYPAPEKSQQIFEVNLDDASVFRASVCDGATDSIFSKLWAQLLANSYGAGKLSAEIDANSIVAEQGAWHEFLAAQQLPWYAEEKAELGAFAAMVGLTLVNESNQWSALALGDCCIFHVRNGECISSFPITESAAFSNFPLLICSVAERNANVFESKQLIANATWQSGDQFYLMSDTVACWFLSQLESGNGREVIAALNTVTSLDAFVSLVNHARTTKGEDGTVAMRDDDVTVTVITVANASSPRLPLKFDTRVLEAGSRPTADLPRPKIGANSKVDLPPLPVKPAISLSPVDAQSAASSASNIPAVSAVSIAVAPRAAFSDDTARSGDEIFSSKRSYANRHSNRAKQPGLGIFVGAVFIIVALGLGVAFLSTNKQTPPAETQSKSASWKPADKSKDASSKGKDGERNPGKHHKKPAGVTSRPVGGPIPAPDISSRNEKTIEHPAPSGRQRIPELAPDITPGQSINSSPMPQPAPERSRIPMPAPDRRGSDRITGSGDHLPGVRLPGDRAIERAPHGARRGLGTGGRSPQDYPENKHGDSPEDFTSR